MTVCTTPWITTWGLRPTIIISSESVRAWHLSFSSIIWISYSKLSAHAGVWEVQESQFSYSGYSGDTIIYLGLHIDIVPHRVVSLSEDRLLVQRQRLIIHVGWLYRIKCRQTAYLCTTTSSRIFIPLVYRVQLLLPNRTITLCWASVSCAPVALQLHLSPADTCQFPSAPPRLKFILDRCNGDLKRAYDLRSTCTNECIDRTRYPIPFPAELVRVLGPEEALRSYRHRCLIDSWKALNTSYSALAIAYLSIAHLHKMSAQADLATPVTERSKSGEKDDEEKNSRLFSSLFHTLAKLFIPLQIRCTLMDPLDSPNSTTPTLTRRTQSLACLKMTPLTQKSDRLWRILMIWPFQCQPYVLGSWVWYLNTLIFVKQR